MSNFRTQNGDFHLIDTTGNHFVNKKCVNPTVSSLKNIGDTHPKESERTPLPEFKKATK
jgi:hypothetical protein